MTFIDSRKGARLLAGTGVDGAAIDKRKATRGNTLYSKSTKRIPSTRGDGPEAGGAQAQRRAEAAAAARRKVQDKFGARYPKETEKILSDFSSAKFPQGLASSDLSRMKARVEALARLDAADAYLTAKQPSAGLRNHCKLDLLKDSVTRSTTGGFHRTASEKSHPARRDVSETRDSLDKTSSKAPSRERRDTMATLDKMSSKGPPRAKHGALATSHHVHKAASKEPLPAKRDASATIGDLRSATAKEVEAQVRRAHRKARAHLCGTALRSQTFIPAEGFRSLEDLGKAMNEKGLISAGMAGVRGRDVFLLPEILNHRGLGPVGDVIAMSIALEILSENVLGKDNANDLKLALQRLGQHVDFPDTEAAGVDLATGREIQILDALITSLTTNGEETDVGGEIREKRLEIDQLMAEAAKGVNSREEIVRIKQRIEMAVSRLRRLTRELVAEVADLVLSPKEAKQTRDVIMETLDALAGKEGKAFAEKAARGAGAQLEQMKAAVDNAFKADAKKKPVITVETGQQFFLELPEGYDFNAT
jgi:hypothetical protein